MKKLFVIVCLLSLCVTVSEAGVVNELKKVIAAKKVDGVAPPDCSGTASFLWSCTSTTVNLANNSCSDGDDSAGSSDEETITDGWCIFDDIGDDGWDRYLFNNGADVLADDQLGTIFIKFRLDTYAANSTMWRLLGNGPTDNIQVLIDPDAEDEAEAHHKGDGDQTDVVTTPAANMTTGTEYIVRYRWRDGTYNPDHDIYIYLASTGEEISGDGDNEALTAFTTEAGDNDFMVGNGYSYNGQYLRIDYIHVYHEWLETADPTADQD